MTTSPLSRFLRQLGYVVLERKPIGTFSLLSDAPDWFVQFFPEANSEESEMSIAEKFPFLDNFLLDAERFWKTPQPGFCESGTWIEETITGKEVPLEAKALHLDGKQILALNSPDPQYSEQLKILQTARNSILEHEKVLSEIQKKEILLHCIVHDLSQPLSAMRGSFDCLAMESDPENVAKFVDLGRHASQQQESMIREILKAFSSDLKATLDAEKEMNAKPDLLAAAKKAMLTLEPAFEAKSIRLALRDEIAKDTNWQVQGEETRLCRIFANLLENALRYTPAGSGVTIGIEDDRGFVKAFVDDEGPGLPDDLRPAQIFALFAKGKESGGKAGLGLYFCRITVERWGGSIGCASLTEKGSRFWFRLPRATRTADSPHRRKTEALMDETKQESLEKRRGLHVLLADDQEDIRLLTSHQLQRNGHEVTAVADGKAALELAQSEHFDVILLDEQMPVMSGVQTARAIRDYQKTQDARSVLIALTGNNTPEDRDRLLAAGFDTVLDKPFRLEILDRFLRDPHQRKISTPEAAPKENHTTEDAKLEDVLQRVGGDDALLRQMIGTFLRETQKRMRAIRKALHRKNGAELSSYAHALKGSVSIFGAVRAAQHTQILQELGRNCDFQEARRVFVQLKEEIANLEQNLRGYAKQALAGTSPKVKRKRAKSKKSLPRKH